MNCFRLVINEVFSIPFSVTISDDILNKSDDAYIKKANIANAPDRIGILDLSKSLKIVFRKKTKTIRKRLNPNANLTRNSFLKFDFINIEYYLFGCMLYNVSRLCC